MLIVYFPYPFLKQYLTFLLLALFYKTYREQCFDVLYGMLLDKIYA